MIVGEYIWYDDNYNFRSKSRTITDKFKTNELNSTSWPEWNYDGSSTNQATCNYSEIILQPKCIVKDPFRTRMGFTDAYLVLCDTYSPNGIPTQINKRVYAQNIFNYALKEKPWFGLEQEYFMMENELPIGLTDNKEQLHKKYCGVGNKTIFGRELADTHYYMCLTAGLQLSGMNAEVAPGQWEFQVGPCEGILAGDHLWLSRYILVRLSEEFNITIDFNPKPLNGDWNGSGCHTNFSTLKMRDGDIEEGVSGLDYIGMAIYKLSKKHDEHMKVYGKDNELRMTGEHETSNYHKFTNGVANRGCSVRIPTIVLKNNKGYFEDRRPASNCDPYLVTSLIFT